MKKSQRLRLTALLGKDQAPLTDAEKAELATLQALATANPDASKDTDDTTPAAAPAAAAAPAPEPAGAAGASTAPPAAPTLRGFLASLKGNAAMGAELVTARTTIATQAAQLSALNSQLSAKDSQLSALNSQLASANAQLSAFAAFFGLAVADLANKKPAEVNALITQKISDQAAEQVSAIGFPLSQLPAPKNGESSGDTFAEKLATFAAMPAGKEKDAFYAREIAPGFAAQN
jgi:hypothetical protein